MPAIGLLLPWRLKSCIMLVQIAWHKGKFWEGANGLSLGFLKIASSGFSITVTRIICEKLLATSQRQ